MEAEYFGLLSSAGLASLVSSACPFGLVDQGITLLTFGVFGADF